MSEALPLRPYQREAITKFRENLRPDHNRLATVLPTGSGKTVVFSHLADQMHREHGVRTLILAHREELIRQAANKVRAVAPHLKIGVVKAEEDEHDGTDVIVASQQTLAIPKRREAITGVGLVIVDEAHHAAAPTYMEVLDHFGSFNGLPTAGFTATLARQDGGLADVWQKVTYQRDILQMIGDRYLVDVRGKTVVVDGFDLDSVSTRGGDFQDGQLGQALDESGAAKVVADAYIEHASDRPGVIFTPTVASAQHMAEVMTNRGIPTGAVWGAMPKEERAETLEKFANGDLQVLSNCMVLTEGFDAPWASCAVIARPTKSAPLYVQMVGRVLRPFQGKKDALVLDVMGASTRHKLASLIDLTEADITISEDESLAEAAERDQLQAPRPGEVEWADVNLFSDSAIRWLRTHGGTWFIPAGDHTEYFLIRGDDPETYHVRKYAKAEGGFRPPPSDPPRPLEMAMRCAEEYAERRPGRISQRSAAWRSGPPTGQQLAMCKRMKVTPGSTKGETSDAIAVQIASHRIDNWVRAARGRAA